MAPTSPSGHESRPFLVTTSWDDGHPADLRLAELLARHNVAGTFYIPNTNIEGRPVISPAQIRQLEQHFEVGGHTRDHVTLAGCSKHEAAEQISSNKAWLEDAIGRNVTSFAYVRGYHTRTIRRLVRDAGFTYARTVENLSDRPSPDRYRMPATAQFFPHASRIYIRNYMSGRRGLGRLMLLRGVLGKGRLQDRLRRTAEYCAERGGCFHLWGHSWELDDHNLWPELDEFLACLASLRPCFVTNSVSWSLRLSGAASAPGTTP